MAAFIASLSVQACNPCKLHALHGCTDLLASALIGAAKRASVHFSRPHCTVARCTHPTMDRFFRRPWRLGASPIAKDRHRNHFQNLES